jgi:hypothetical protein
MWGAQVCHKGNQESEISRFIVLRVAAREPLRAARKDLILRPYGTAKAVP